MFLTHRSRRVPLVVKRNSLYLPVCLLDGVNDVLVQPLTTEIDQTAENLGETPEENKKTDENLGETPEENKKADKILGETPEENKKTDDDEHQHLGRSAPVLGPGSRLEDLRKRLKELSAPIYGTKETLWKRLMEAEARAEAKRKEEEYLAQRSKELESAGEPKPGMVLPGPDAPSELERAQHELTHIPSRRWCEYCQMGKGAADPHS
eukprot:2130881-Amphidinium_carterae.1